MRDVGAGAVPEGLATITTHIPTVETVGYHMSSRCAGLSLTNLRTLSER